MSLIAVGLFFALVSFNYDFLSLNTGSYVTINILPDFIGFLILTFALEKHRGINRWFHECQTYSSGMLVVTFLVFVTQIQFLFSGYLEYGEFQWMGIVLALLSVLFSKAEYIIMALNMFTGFFFCYALGTEYQERENRFVTVLLYVFSILFAGLGVLCVVYEFIRFNINIRFITTPVAVLFIIVAYFAGKNIKEIGD